MAMDCEIEIVEVIPSVQQSQQLRNTWTRNGQANEFRKRKSTRVSKPTTFFGFEENLSKNKENEISSVLKKNPPSKKIKITKQSSSELPIAYCKKWISSNAANYDNMDEESRHHNSNAVNEISQSESADELESRSEADADMVSDNDLKA